LAASASPTIGIITNGKIQGSLPNRKNPLPVYIDGSSRLVGAIIAVNRPLTRLETTRARNWKPIQ